MKNCDFEELRYFENFDFEELRWGALLVKFCLKIVALGCVTLKVFNE